MAVMSGCSINHPVAKDYPQFLEKHANSVELPKTNIQSDYFIDGETQNNRYEFRAATVGYAHLWIVEFGTILDESLNAPYVQNAFGRLTKTDEGHTQDGNLIEFSLENYEFKNYHAYVSMRIKLMDGNNVTLDKVYSVEGASKGSQMFWGGPFGMKNATLDSTKTAIDKILADFINDIPST
ncbi:hypothetical protein GCM10011352_19950 [Marinobacterium zhoushanense]|uniref:Lipoprotein n=1 Tax=Marinobacterium zhoushanense TaxID=1679163 RepID=A0ABQ1KE10_9GAMM|nr:hypothetical protein GCM10011352_19950 [Marinobacterium zhoushanense]